ncbi:MAG: protein translocase subunit SecD [Fuerstiella sp.]
MFEMLTAVMTLAVQDETVAEATDVVVEQAEVVAENAANVGGGGAFAIFVAGLIGSFVLGAFLAKSMRMTEWSLRFGVCLAALAIGVMPFAVRMINGESLGQGLRLGIDLAGGTNMVFKVEEDPEKPLNDAIMDKMVTAVGKRVNPTGTSEITVRQVGRDRIEVIVPGKDPQTVAEIKRRIVKLGSLEFFITVNPTIDDASLVRQARELSLEEKKLTRTLADGTEEVYAMWVPAYEKDGQPQLLKRSDVVKREIEKYRIEDGDEEKYTTEEYLVLVDPPDQQVTGKYLKNASPGIDPRDGGQVVNFQFDSRGAFLFSRLTSRFQPQPGKDKRGLGIVLDGQIYSAPDINDVISDNGQISGSFTLEEVRELSGVLNAGALEVPINKKPLSEATVDPTLGEDVRKKGVQAIFVASVVVVLFMLVYYRFAGIVAVICLILNLLLVLTVMMSINATFTLPGLAGLVLTIGMAVDANVLIFERMREEANRGSSLRMAIQNGFGKAFTTIIDANVTTLITAAILYAIGTDTVKGFAVSLFIGIVVSMFTALYVGRVVFDVAEKKRWVKKLGMFSLVGNTSVDFLSKRFVCGVFSVLLIAGGLAAFASRGNSNYDIDFTGGTMVTFQLTETAETDDVRDVLETQFESNFTVERLTLAGEEAAGGSRHFRLRTTESDSEENAGEADSAEDRVREKVYQAFKDEPSMHLLMVEMQFTDPEAFTVAEDDESAEALRYRRFSGGHASTIELSSEVAVGTIFDNLKAAIEGLSADGSQKYVDASEFIGIEGLDGSGLQAAGQDVQKFDRVMVRVTPNVAAEDIGAALAAMKSQLDSEPLFDEVNTFASAVASEMKTSAVMAVIISLLAIVAYIWFRFQKITFGLAAVVALVHDVLIVLGMMALASYMNGSPIGRALLLNDFRINLPMVAAFLTIVGYSLNDTIVVFDRIREVRGKNPNLTNEIVNTSLNQTLSRTLLTSLTTFLVVIILYTLGGEGIHGFAFCLTLGVVVGTYSSIYVASPVLVWLMNRNAKTA